MQPQRSYQVLQAGAYSGTTLVQEPEVDMPVPGPDDKMVLLPPPVIENSNVVMTAFVVLTEHNTWQVVIKFDPPAPVPIRQEAALVLHNEVCQVVRLGLPPEGNGNGHQHDAGKAGATAGLIH